MSAYPPSAVRVRRCSTSVATSDEQRLGSWFADSHAERAMTSCVLPADSASASKRTTAGRAGSSVQCCCRPYAALQHRSSSRMIWKDWITWLVVVVATGRSTHRGFGGAAGFPDSRRPLVRPGAFHPSDGDGGVMRGHMSRMIVTMSGGTWQNYVACASVDMRLCSCASFHNVLVVDHDSKFTSDVFRVVYPH